MADTDDVALVEQDQEAMDPELQARMEELANQEPFAVGYPTMLDFISPDEHGIVVDPAIAREAPCIGYQLKGEGTEPDLVYAKGVWGALDRDQIGQFCQTIDVREPSPEFREHLAAFAESAHICHAEVAGLPHGTAEGDRFPAYDQCMSREMRERGHPL